ncbi:MAG: RHS repeat-associated core domain-containing protein, partial [Actinomycetota bacterium]
SELRSYDRAGRLTGIRNVKGLTHLSYSLLTLDAVGNPTTWASDAGATAYTYDNMDRVTEACYTTTCSDFIRYTYDEVGNRLTQDKPGESTTYSYDLADRIQWRFVSQGPTGTNYVYTHDDNGNQTAAGTTSYSYDLANRLKGATVGGSTTTYSYDGDGKRLQASTGAQPSQKTNYLWDRANQLPQLALERDGNNALLRRYVNGHDLISMTSGGADYYYLHDSIGSVVNLTSASGAAQWTYRYQPFGLAKTETQNDPGAPANLMRFTGELYDTATSLYHLRARQYDPTIGRFLQTDPMEPAIKDPFVAAYVYVNNRPTMMVDPSGMRGLFEGGPFPLAIIQLPPFIPPILPWQWGEWFYEDRHCPARWELLRDYVDRLSVWFEDHNNRVLDGELPNGLLLDSSWFARTVGTSGYFHDVLDSCGDAALDWLKLQA